MDEINQNKTKRIAVYLPINIYNGLYNLAEAKGNPLSSEIKNILYVAVEGGKLE